MQDALQDGKVAGVQRVQARTDSELPLAGDVRVHVQRLDEHRLYEIADGERHDEHVRRLVQIAAEQHGENDEHVAENADDDDDDTQHGPRHHHAHGHVVVGGAPARRQHRPRQVVEASVCGDSAGASAHRREEATVVTSGIIPDVT